MKAEETTPPEPTVIDRADIEATLEENGYYRGEPSDNPEKDATHIWYSSDNSKFVMFRIPDDGTVVYGDSREAGVALPYRNMILVLAGLMTLAQARKPTFHLPDGVAKKLAAGAADSKALATTEDEPNKTPRALPPKTAKADDGIFDKKRGSGRGGVL